MVAVTLRAGRRRRPRSGGGQRRRADRDDVGRSGRRCAVVCDARGGAAWRAAVLGALSDADRHGWQRDARREAAPIAATRQDAVELCFQALGQTPTLAAAVTASRAAQDAGALCTLGRANVAQRLLHLLLRERDVALLLLVKGRTGLESCPADLIGGIGCHSLDARRPRRIRWLSATLRTGHTRKGGLLLRTHLPQHAIQARERAQRRDRRR
mmetsp:Transcript_20899/g.52938  ORF Transcript_20899/g.52938 Transcript_20899/m.52938 type:complete len:212 (+) Transcript_20899:152-787(+)